MLTIINLFVIDKIFSEVSETKLGATAKALYVNCLIHHFKDKPATASGAIAFEMFLNDFGNFEKYRKTMQELHKAGLVIIGQNSVAFTNVWGKYIDRSQLGKVSPDEYVAGFQFQFVTKFKDELLNSEGLLELSAMKHKLSKLQVGKLVELFVKEQETFEKKYTNFSDCIKHCSYWIGMNADKVPKEIIKSSGKILGI